MKIPEKIRILGRLWRVEIGDFEQDGTCDQEARVISIKESLTGLYRKEVFIHEVLHALWYETCIDEEEPPPWIEHVFISQLAKEMVYSPTLWYEMFK